MPAGRHEPSQHPLSSCTAGPSLGGAGPTPSTGHAHAAGLGVSAVRERSVQVDRFYLWLGCLPGTCLTQQLARKEMGIKEKDPFGDVAVSLARGRKESDEGEESLGWVWKMRLGGEGGVWGEGRELSGFPRDPGTSLGSVSEPCLP